jgi:hypothetical protein
MPLLLRKIVQTHSLALLALFLQLPCYIAAQEIKPGLIMTAPAAQVRTRAAGYVRAPQSVGAISGTEAIAEIPFRPENLEEYARLKDEADLERDLSSPTGRFQIEPGQPQIQASPSQPIPDIGIEGLNEDESPVGVTLVFPPDTHGAIGPAQFVQVVNSRLAVYDNQTRERLTSVPLNTFFDYFAGPPPTPFIRGLDDPRVVYDRTFDRWVITADTVSAEASDVQFFFIAVSQTGDATGDFFFYRINVTVFPSEFFDFPQLGMDQNAVLITANIFGPRSGSDVLVIPKADLYAGLPLRIPRFLGLLFNTAPPIVLDNNPKTFLVATRFGTSEVFLSALTNTGDPDAVALGPTALVDVGLYNLAPRARQPGTSATLDTLDARFQNAGTQIGNSLFNVHTINFLGFATPRWYEIDTETSSVIQSGILFGATTSDDFNPSIRVNDNKDVFVTWSSTNQGSRTGDPGYQAQVRASGRLDSDPPGTISPGSVVFQSPTFQTLGRWGDYSAISVDPSNTACAWGINEKNQEVSNKWGSFIFRTCFQ